MKILIATGVYPPELGGPATYTKMLETHLPKYGFEVSVLPFSTVRHLPKVIRHIAYFWKCLLLGRDVDSIFAQDPMSVGFPSLLAAKLLGKPFYLRLGGDYAWEQGRLRFGVRVSVETFACAGGRFHWVVRIFQRVQSCVACSALRIAVQSAFMKKIVACWGVPEEKITVIPNGFDGGTVASDRQKEREALNLRGTICVSAGRLVPWKGFAELIEIVPDILMRIPDFVLYIIGDGPERERLHNLVAEKGLVGRVRFTGRLDKKALIRYLASADVFVLNTEYEGFSNQLLEVYSVGTPIVTTDIGGNQGVVGDGISGLLVPVHDRKALKDAVLTVIENKALAQKLVSGGREKLREFSIERVVAATADFLS